MLQENTGHWRASGRIVLELLHWKNPWNICKCEIRNASSFQVSQSSSVAEVSWGELLRNLGSIDHHWLLPRTVSPSFKMPAWRTQVISSQSYPSQLFEIHCTTGTVDMPSVCIRFPHHSALITLKKEDRARYMPNLWIRFRCSAEPHSSFAWIIYNVNQCSVTKILEYLLHHVLHNNVGASSK